MKPLRLILHMAFAAAALVAGSAWAAEAPGDISWYTVVTDNGRTIGHSSQQVAPAVDGVEIIDSQEIDIVEEGTPAEPISWSRPDKIVTASWRTVRKQDLTGRTISVSARSQTGSEWTHTDARIEEGNAEIIRQTPAETRTIVLTLPTAVRFDSGAGLLPAWNPATKPRLEFDDFNIDAMAVDHIVIEAAPGVLNDPPGGIVALRKRFVDGNLLGVTKLVLDGAHRIVQVTQPMFGVGLTIKATDRETALAAHLAFRPLSSAMVKSPFVISSPASEGHIRYRFSFRDGIEFALPQTGEQRVTVEPGFATVDICEECGPGLPTDAAYLADARKPTAWLQSDSPQLKAIADPVAKLGVSDSRKMELLRQGAQPYIRKVDFTGHYSALEILTRRSADCTDAAVLLAALGRAAGIPTRVVNGLVYSRPSYHGVSNVFMPHSWTLAWADGKWRSFDLALDNFDSTHLALTVGDGDERSALAAEQLAGLLHWDSMSEVRTAPAN